ncbi:MAG: hypothetical protein RMJ98_00335, partial [Myxococcales bacterium]|nr:cell division protein FtsH [Polyangiaceae bacterium]MDW8247734.1 hypothetical protein [Myxococcales bacterium]
LGRDFTIGRRDYSEHMAIKIDDEVRRLILDAETRARDILTNKRHILDAIAEALLDRETIDGEELAALHEGKPLPPREKIVIPTWADKEKNAKDKRRSTSIFGPPKPATG